LRAALAFPAEPSDVSERDIKAALDRVELGYLSASLDREAEWGLELTEDEQVRIAIARLLIHKPPWIFAEHVFGALSDEYHDLVRSIFDTELAHSAVISIGPRVPPQALCRKVIHLTTSAAA
jgi:putative ATP-binding cassette transporter